MIQNDVQYSFVFTSDKQVEALSQFCFDMSKACYIAIFSAILRPDQALVNVLLISTGLILGTIFLHQGLDLLRNQYGCH